ncbi:hypothetical protein KB559_02185 [Paenibacillus sp. Marseille-P2973]|uniref:hypothetical protein n=1 Tax=Paenibacillus sp. Marseille-P2973 TaxID=1871032 RepID=UPI001B378F10|nr:hypothetical protein [Paenibacillus sp. Marseille-P2973]MBQ4897648.1 hypothetical protein [Paenibacillus sp. Marseille-P2973]
MRRSLFIFLTLFTIFLSGCNSSDRSLADVVRDIRKTIPNFTIPTLHGYEVNAVFDVSLPQSDTSAFIINYTERKGKKLKSEFGPEDSIQALYGPYEGDGLLDIGISEPVSGKSTTEYENTRIVNGLTIQYNRSVPFNAIMISTEYNGLSYLASSRSITNQQDEEQFLELFTKALKE